MIYEDIRETSGSWKSRAHERWNHDLRSLRSFAPGGDCRGVIAHILTHGDK